MAQPDRATKRVLFVHNRATRFVQLDHAILAERYDVTEWHARARIPNLASLARAVGSHDLIFGWFASWHTAVPVLAAARRGPPSVLVVGGYDVAAVPGLAYGTQRLRVVAGVTRRVMQASSLCLAFSESARLEAVRTLRGSGPPVDVVYLGVPDNSGALPPHQKRTQVVTVGDVNRSNLARKGHLAFVRTAALLPDVPFVLVGEWQDRAIEILRASAPANVRFAGRLDRMALDQLLAESSVYLQASAHEGFGLSVAEAMLAGCIPVVTRAGSLPEVVGSTGRIAAGADPVELARLITESLGATAEQRAAARAHVVTNFSIDRRRRALFAHVDGLLVRDAGQRRGRLQVASRSKVVSTSDVVTK